MFLRSAGQLSKECFELGQNRVFLFCCYHPRPPPQVCKTHWANTHSKRPFLWLETNIEGPIGMLDYVERDVEDNRRPVRRLFCAGGHTLTKFGTKMFFIKISEVVYDFSLFMATFGRPRPQNIPILR